MPNIIYEMKVKTYIVNAFAEKMAQGNQAGVVIVEEKLPDDVMQKMAFDIGKSETAFVEMDVQECFIRWFSPLKEMPLCGHATLAAAKVLTEVYGMTAVAFRYKGGKLTAATDADGGIGLLFPKDDYKKIEFDSVYQDFFHIPESACLSCIQGLVTRKVAVIIDRRTPIGQVKPNFSLMRSYSGICNYGIGISQLSDRYDFETRYFNPWAGVDEDFVTGSIHTVLVNYWGKVLGKSKLTSFQSSPRPGVISMELVGSDKVLISGKAKIIMEGMFFV